MGGFNTFLFNLDIFNGVFSSVISESGGSPINDRISIQGVALASFPSPSLPNGFNGASFNGNLFNGAPYKGSSGQNITTVNDNEIMRISVAKG
jgi:hypothetical protein